MNNTEKLNQAASILYKRQYSDLSGEEKKSVLKWILDDDLGKIKNGRS